MMNVNSIGATFQLNRYELNCEFCFHSEQMNFILSQLYEMSLVSVN